MGRAPRFSGATRIALTSFLAVGASCHDVGLQWIGLGRPAPIDVTVGGRALLPDGTAPLGAACTASTVACLDPNDCADAATVVALVTTDGTGRFAVEHWSHPWVRVHVRHQDPGTGVDYAGSSPWTRAYASHPVVDLGTIPLAPIHPASAATGPRPPGGREPCTPSEAGATPSPTRSARVVARAGSVGGARVLLVDDLDGDREDDTLLALGEALLFVPSSGEALARVELGLETTGILASVARRAAPGSTRRAPAGGGELPLVPALQSLVLSRVAALGPSAPQARLGDLALAGLAAGSLPDERPATVVELRSSEAGSLLAELEIALRVPGREGEAIRLERAAAAPRDAGSRGR